ncbi:MAG: ABC transporter permease [Longimicrobiales bacterium]
MIDDLKSAFHSLRARPGVALIAVGCLALGIGVNIALFGVVDALLFQPPAGVVDPETLVRVRLGVAPTGLASGVGPTANFPQFRTVSQERSGLMAGFAAYGRRDGTRDGGLDAAPVTMTVVTSDYFTVLGVQPTVGRFFEGSEGVPDAGVAVAVLSHSYWTRAYGADPTVMGRSFRVNGVQLEIIGVAPEGFVGVDLGAPDLWIPMGLVGLPEFGGDRYYSDRVYWLQFVGRLRPGVSLSQALEMTKPSPTEQVPFVPRPYSQGSGNLSVASIPVSILPLRTMFFENQQGRNPVPLWTLGISAAVLLLACGTVANLLLAQAVIGRRDVAIRLALGASPARIIRTQLLQSLLLALSAASVSSAFAVMSVVLIRRLPMPPIPGVLNARSMLFGVFVAMLTPLVFGVVPALWAARREVGGLIRGGAVGAAAVPRLQTGFMAAQTAISFALLLMGGLFLRSLMNARSIDTGMDIDRVVMVYTDLGSRVEDAPGMDVVAASLDQVSRLPGVESVALGGIVPFYMFTRGSFRIHDGRSDEEQPQSVIVNTVSPEFFRSLGIQILAGRGFAESDEGGASPVAILSERLVGEEWAGVPPIGKCIDVGGASDGACTEVVGVAADVNYEGLVGESSAVLYLPVEQVAGAVKQATLFVRMQRNPGQMIPAIRAAVQALDPSLPYPRIETLNARMRPKLMQWEVGTKLFSALGALAALLAAVGLYMVVSFSASQRLRELGVRSALGAGRAQLLGLVLFHGMKVSGLGLGVGVVLAAASGALLKSQLFGLTYTDLPTYLVVAGAMMVIAAAASLRPAIKAARADPAVVLRGE